MVRLIRALGARYPTVLLPLHPRTRDRLERAGWLDEVRSAPGVRVCAPLPYTELLTALSASQIVVTDSGGLQEEAAFFGVPVVVMRHSTPRWEGVAEGSTLLTGLHCARVLAAVERLTEQAELTRVASLPCPYGDGTTARQVCGALAEPVVRQLLSPREPPFDPARPLPHLPRLKQARGPTTGPPARSEPSPSTSTTRCSRSPPGCREPGRQWRTSARGSAWIVLPSTPLSWRSRPKAATAARSSTGPCPAQVVARYTSQSWWRPSWRTHRRA